MGEITLLLPLAMLPLAWLMTGGLRQYALARNLVDMPNERSSHTEPTPKSGGTAFVVAFLLGLGVLLAMDVIAGRASLALLLAGLSVAVAGFVDDHRAIAVRWRLLAHFAAAAGMLLGIGELPIVSFFGFEMSHPSLAFPLAALVLVWLLNLYNFMDGIDGIASVEAITVCVVAALICRAVAPQFVFGWLAPLLLAGAVGGFLIWNFPPAKIFMGDSGSGFLGFVLAAFAIVSAKAAPQLFWVWMIMLGVFIVDATTTLFRRLRRGERIYLAHRSHAYQYAARRCGAHAPVTMAVAGINLLWLAPIAALVGLQRVDGAIGLLIAYVPLLWLAYRFKAGARELQET